MVEGPILYYFFALLLLFIDVFSFTIFAILLIRLLFVMILWIVIVSLVF